MPQPATNSWKKTSNSQDLAQLATDAALAANWKEAAKINEKILSVTRDDVEALNRLAKALASLGQTAKAVKVYKRTLEIDPYNIIAKKNLYRMSKADGHTNGHGNNHYQTDLTSLFLSEPGKTKLVNLYNVASPNILATLSCGDILTINPKNHAVTITTGTGNYLGALPDDLAHRLLTFIAGGNKYEAYVKCATPKNLTIFIRETERSPKFINQPSFNSNINSYLEN